MKYRAAEKIGTTVLLDAISRTPLDQFVIWTGLDCGGSAGSLRGQALKCVREVWTPVQLREVLQRAATVSGELGFDPDAVRKAVHAHQSARPAVYLLVRRTAGGHYVTVTDVPWPGGADKPLGGGEMVLDASGAPRLRWICRAHRQARSSG